MGAILQIKLGDLYYRSFKVYDSSDVDTVKQVTRVLYRPRGLEKNEGTPEMSKREILQQILQIPLMWEKCYDLVYPLDNSAVQPAFDSCWVFDLDGDVPLITVTKPPNLYVEIPIHQVVAKPLTMDDLLVAARDPPVVPEPRLPPPSWDLGPRGASVLDFPGKNHAQPFAEKLLADFVGGWHHIFENLERHNDVTFHRMAWAVTQILKFDYEIKSRTERSMMHGLPAGGVSYVTTTSLPPWPSALDIEVDSLHSTLQERVKLQREKLQMARENKAALTTVVNNGVRWLVIRRLEDGPEVVEHYQRQREREGFGQELSGVGWDGRVGTASPLHKARHVYVVCTLRHVAMCRINAHGQQEWTAPVEFIRGATYAPTALAEVQAVRAFESQTPEPPGQPTFELLPTERAGPPMAAGDMATWALIGQPLAPTRLHRLYPELQTLVLELAAPESSLSAAKIGASLRLGLQPYCWEDRKGRWERETLKKRRLTEDMPVESMVYFGGVMSGLSYTQTLTLEQRRLVRAQMTEEKKARVREVLEGLAAMEPSSWRQFLGRGEDDDDELGWM